MNKAQNIKIIKNEENPETPELLAASLIKISDAMEKLSSVGNLDNDALAALLLNMKGMSQVNRTSVMLVLENLPKLKGYYIRK